MKTLDSKAIIEVELITSVLYPANKPLIKTQKATLKVNVEHGAIPM
jgi:hypothetical protein